MYAERLKCLYSSMLRLRMVDNVLSNLVPKHESIQQREAVLAGAAIHLQQDDFVAPAGRLKHEIIHAQSFAEMFAQVKAARGNRVGVKSRRPAVAPSTAATFNTAAGMALANKLQKKSGITLCLAEEINGSTDFWREAVSFASARQLAVVFVVSYFGEAQSGVDLRAEAQVFLPAITVDGSDVVAVYRVAEETTRRARQGLGPSLIECRIDSERDPLRFMEEYLTKRNLWSDAWKRALIQQYTREIDAAVSKTFRRSATRRKTAASA